MRAIIEKTIAGDAAAWKTLWGRVEPRVWALTGRARLTGMLARREDERRNICLAVMERLAADDFRRLRAYLEHVRGCFAASSPEEERHFGAWIATVATRVALDYVR